MDYTSRILNDIISEEIIKFKENVFSKSSTKISEKSEKRICTFILTSGKNKGTNCKSVIKDDDNELCSRHTIKTNSSNNIFFDEPRILKRIDFNGKNLMTDGESLYEESSDHEGIYVGKLTS
jgi:hypothetical protein